MMRAPMMTASVSNSEFLRHVGMAAPAGSALWVTHFIGAPGTSSPWHGEVYSEQTLVDRWQSSNTYYSVAAFVPGLDGTYRRRKQNFARLLVLVVDDADESKLVGTPSYVLSTSPGKTQVGVFLDESDPDCADMRIVDRLMVELVRRGLVGGDISGNNAVRYVRLPVGQNQKPRPSGHYAHELLNWHPEVRLTLDDAAAVLGIDLDEIKRAITDKEPQIASTIDQATKLRECARLVIEGHYHEPLNILASSMVASGMPGGAVVNMLRGLMDASLGPRDARWKERYDDIVRSVQTAEEKYRRGETDSTAAAGLVGAAAFCRSLRMPDWIWRGILQRGFVYGLTAPTNSGKTALLIALAIAIAAGIPFAGRNIRRGRVLYLAGENPDDVKLRILATAQLYGVSLEMLDDWLIVRPGADHLNEIAGQIIAEASAMGEFVLVIVDTSAAYYSYQSEDDNMLARQHGQDLRTLASISGMPAVVAATHPTKHAQRDALLPRGGSGLLNELDGNLTLWKTDEVLELGWTKLRGPSFESPMFRLEAVTIRGLYDTDGHPVASVAVKPLAEGDVETAEAAVRTEEDRVLEALAEGGKLTQVQVAESAGLFDSKGKPARWKAYRTLNKLIAERLVKRVRDRYFLTELGRKEASDVA